jgi:hypothetical protein
MARPAIPDARRKIDAGSGTEAGAVTMVKL